MLTTWRHVNTMSGPVYTATTMAVLTLLLLADRHRPKCRLSAVTTTSFVFFFGMMKSLCCYCCWTCTLHDDETKMFVLGTNFGKTTGRKRGHRVPGDDVVISLVVVRWSTSYYPLVSFLLDALLLVGTVLVFSFFVLRLASSYHERQTCTRKQWFQRFTTWT